MAQDDFDFSAAIAIALLSAITVVWVRGLNRQETQNQSEKQGITIFNDVGLPNSVSKVSQVKNFFQLNKRTNKEVIEYLLRKDGVQEEIKMLVGSNKPLDKTNNEEDLEIFKKIQQKTIDNIIKYNGPSDPDPIEGYLYFGNKDFKKILGSLCQVNPFFASALTLGSEGEPELIAYSTAEPSDSDAKYLRIVRELTDPSHCINVAFNMDMSIKSMSRLDQQSGEVVSIPSSEWNYYASGVFYNVVYYASVVHATIHVLHFLMTNGIIHSTRHNKTLAAWANPYDDNIAVKYDEVALQLFDSSLGNRDNKLLTGKNGFGATEQVNPIARELLSLWGSFKNTDDYMTKFLLKDMYDSGEDVPTVLENCNILTEFTKHINNVQPFADELSAAMEKNNAKAFVTAQRKLKTFMAGCGQGVSSISTISSWVSLMSCTGITHGSTLSYTRCLCMPEVMRWRDIIRETWDENDRLLISGGLGTIVGMTLDRHVFTDSIEHGVIWNTKPIAAPVMAVLEKYDGKAEHLKEAYKAEIVKRSDFRDFGWILTDHCEDGYDGKQHTIATYI